MIGDSIKMPHIIRRFISNKYGAYEGDLDFRF